MSLTKTSRVWIVTLCAMAQSAGAATYKIDQEASRMRVFTAKAGFFARAGHTHEVLATRLAGEIVADADKPSAARLSLSVPAAGLAVQDPEFSAADRAAVQKNMEGDRTLDVARFPLIRYTSRAVVASRAGDDWNVKIDGMLELHGVTRRLTVPAVVTLAKDRLVARGEVELAQKDFGITPFKAVMGAVGVKNEVKIRFEIVAPLSPAAGR